MALDDTWDVRQQILNVMAGIFRESPDQSTSDNWIAETIFPNRTKSLITSEMKLMAEENLLKKDIVTTSGDVFYFITAKGIDAESTTYNHEWQESQQRQKQAIEEKEKLEKEETKNEEKKRHDEMVEIAKDANKFSKYGTWIAIILGGAGLLVAIFKP